MQNFPNSPVPLHPGFSRGGSVVGSPYQPHPSDLQISPRNSEDYATMQQAQPTLQSHGLHLRSQQHLLHAPPIHGYGSRRSTGEMTQGNTHSGGGGNSYRKDSVDYYFSMSGRERSRRSGAAYGVGFRYTNMDGHAPHQYQHLSGSGSSSGMISPYSMDYGSSSASAVGGSNSSGAGSFSPSQQYSLAHTASVQSGAQMQQRQHGQKYPSHQGLHQGQHHRTLHYPLSGNRIPPQFGHYAPLNATSGSTGIYNSPPQRYDVSSSSNTDAKMNNSPTQSNPNTHTSSSASNCCENMGQNYSSAAHPPYSPQSQSLNKHALHSQCTSQHSTGAGYDPSLKMQHQGHMHTKLPHSSVSSSPALPSHPSQDLAKSPVHSQSQQVHIHQNFSPISNPSPAPSAVQSPSCSSSSSPLMGSSEGNNATTYLQPSSHPSVSNARSSQSHGRLLQAVPQLSPTPNSNSSISSCGSGVGTKTAVLNHSAGIGHAAVSQNRMGLSLQGGPGEDVSLYPHDKLLQDPGLNSLNALTSQVENLPNTVQHMLLTDTVLPLKKSRDSAHHLQIQQGSQSLSGNQNKSGNSSTSGQISVNEESSEMLETKGHQQVERKRIRQASGTSNESEPQSYPSSQSQMPSEASQQVLDLQVNTGVISTASKQPSTRESQSKTPETLTPSSSSPPSVHPSAEPSPKQPVYLPAPPSPIHSAHPNCVAEKDLCNDDDSGMKGRRIKIIKDEECEVENAGPSCDRENSENRRSVPPTKDEAETDAQQFENLSKNVNVSEKHNVGGVGVIVSARSEVNTESSKHTGARSPHYGVSHYSNKHSNPEDQRDVNVLRETRNHNGEGEMCMETYVSQYISPKQEFGQSSQPSIQSHPVSFKYSNPEGHYNAAKSKGKLGLGSSMGTNRCQNYHQLQANYGSIGRKEIGVFAMEGGRAIVSRSQDSSSQFQQSFPSLLQEVLQGHHLDRRYGRPDQTSSVHQQPQDTYQHRYQTRLPYSMIENLSPHAMGSQTLMSGLNVKFNQMASGKPPNSSQNQGSDNDIVLGPLHPSWDSEAHKPNVTHGISLEKGKTILSPSQSSHMQQSLDLTTGAPSKHINLADYSLQHRKPSRYGTSPSAVEQLLLQEAEPLACGVGPISRTQSQTSSSTGRRSVICDVSPSRRTTPERERGHSGTSGTSVIQQPFSSSGSNEQECCKEESKAKKAQNKEDSSKTETAGQNTDGYCSTLPSKESNKPLHPPVDVDSDIEKTSSAKGNREATSNLPYLLQMSSNPLSSPPRHQSFSQAVDGFRVYGFSDTMDGPKMISHPTPHKPFHTVSAYSKTAPSTNKLQVFPQSLPPPVRPDWTPDRQRLRGMDRHVPQRLSEQKCKSEPSSDILASQHHLSRQHSYPGSHFDMKMWDTYPEREGAGQPTTVPHEHVGSQPVTNAGPKLEEEDISDKSAENTSKSFHSIAPVGAVSPAGHTGKTTQGIQQGQRATKTGASAETNPLIMRRRVRSFISPIPAKRQHQDVSGQRPGSAYHSPLSQSHSDSRLATNNCSGSTDTQPKLPSPKTQHSIPSANSPSQSKAKFITPRKGHGLKLEAIVRKITPGVKKNDFNNSRVGSDFSEVSHYTSDIPDPEGGTSFSGVPQGEEACLSYLDDSHTLDDLMPYRAVEDAFSCDSQTLKPGTTASSTSALRSLPKDFDFGLGAAGSSGSLGENVKDDFTLLGPLPPAPPLPCPVQGSPPSSSALSDIQQFTNTYQQLETRRGEQSAANLLRQKLQETGMGFDDYPGGDYYGTTTGHSQSPGHHLLSRAAQHQMTSLRLTSSEPKTSENTVPKGYFPSGKKKGRPVGSVNKQKRAQAQIQNAETSIPVDSLPSPTAEAQSVPIPDTASEVSQVSTPPDQKPCPSLTPPAQTQVVKVDVESEETQPESDVKPARHRQKKGKEGNETPGNQRRKRRGMASNKKLDTQASSRGNMNLCGIFSDARNNVFAPYIHVEKKITEIGAVCTIINAEDEKSKGGGKTGHLGVDGPLNTPVSSQLLGKENENERTKENWVSEPVDSALQSGKTLPTSEYVLPGPVISETGHTGRLLCCLCQKWANYKHLGDLYGPFYPAEYAAKLPKNQPQVRQTLSYHGAATTGFSMTSIPTETTPQDTRLQDPQNVKSSTDSDCTVSQATNPTSPATTIGTVSPSMGEEMLFQNAKTSSSTSKVTAHTWDSTAELTSGLGTSKAQELDGELVLKQLQVENTQQRPQHRKLTSHPRFKRRHKSSEDLPRTVPINSKASLPFQPPPPNLDSLGTMAQLSQLPLVPLDPEELWVHEGCIVWTSGVYLVNGRLYGLQEALDGARDTSCSHCEMVGSTLGCYSKGCTLRFHYLCAIEADCSLNEDNFSLRCPKHKSKISHVPVFKYAATELPSLERRIWSSQREDEHTLD
ncbi:transcription factor 20 isoform X2 [Sinocyclocheilus rhinocerous]|uniref:Transcription factor 20-like n=1 Tax=Sinocyclocheilus rhinocerous TaxID=307959 RepID=A0A673J645_9TELE|nr:PREDICTED: transcription factor 20-like isoform X2 [Sinocyclocheilus rhinocerous]XP_016431557.1 PREDICTED: transcription factor 20-like isoform X2 [Sinocyclocheilus rhinocerous]